MQVGETSKDGKNAYLACSASKLHNPFCSVLDLDLENCLDLHLSMMYLLPLRALEFPHYNEFADDNKQFAGCTLLQPSLL